MAQRHSTPTLPKWNSATNVSPLEHESSPKNDISCSLALLTAHHQLKVRRGHSPCAEHTGKVDHKPFNPLDRLNHLKMLSRGQNPLQKEEIAELKAQGLDETLKALFPNIGQKCFGHHEVYDFLTKLAAVSSMGGWHVRENAQEIIVYARYGSIFPGLRFKKQGDGYRCVGFNFNIRLAS
ncbi:hypothetical protein [Vibrio neptunius]|uniref:Uncharacterized protein n=1 Tax=Vibrio neptunius TaxID=170651 RepID=A0ABS3AAY8_9VIBR|nr:hypothetical protein [Vibrio neptunius]MBN3495689.1 hypothetical protein [Vibrio neptunius]MBN3517525.1 hypothetical protein [Vibrio neptunius]MBN3551862.1 hypothetical protein [Vibrio neptunius]MBN3580514.1 hypothetical protein [Vibrio neptunius]MCH9874181.1 hypothetical protein [Vibrio neptunius]